MAKKKSKIPANTSRRLANKKIAIKKGLIVERKKEYKVPQNSARKEALKNLSVIVEQNTEENENAN